MIQYEEACYMCDSPSSGREHVPPKCYFPKLEDTITGESLRGELITVPSCDEHNSSKSKDDEYACFVVSFHFENNIIGAHSAVQKFLRAIKYNQSLIHILKEPFRITLRGRPTIGFKVDAARVDRVFDHAARGIYFHHFRARHFGPVALIYPPTFFVGRPQYEHLSPTKRQWLTNGQDAISSSQRYGANQDAFYYQVLEWAECGWVLIKLVLFEGLEVDCLLTDV